ncbi:hypothetical protein BDW72DRAFT_184725 [Aspergillus terricola var. indicus]
MKSSNLRNSTRQLLLSSFLRVLSDWMSVHLEMDPSPQMDTGLLYKAYAPIPSAGITVSCPTMAVSSPPHSAIDLSSVLRILQQSIGSAKCVRISCAYAGSN